MSNKTNLSKKGQYYPRPSYSSVHPLFVVGIVIFVFPLVSPIFKVNVGELFTNILMGIGVMTILIGAALSIFKASN